MKRYTKIWLISFSVTIAMLTVAIIIFMNFMKTDNAELKETAKPQPQTETNISINYTEPQDNVGAVSFTEDQMTEIARKLFSLDGFITDLNIEFDDDSMTIIARIKDKEKLAEIYPELKKYDAILTSIENKKIVINSCIVNDDGRAAVSVTEVTVGGTKIDGEVISPFIETNEFSSLFDVEYESIDVSDGEVVFKNGVPDILDIG